MIWTAPARRGGGCAKLDVPIRSNYREEQSNEDYDYRYRPVQAILQRSRRGCTWQSHAAQDTHAGKTARVASTAAFLPGGARGLWRSPRHGASSADTRARCTADGGQVRAPLPQEPEKRRQRRRGDLRGGGAAQHALRSDQVSGAASFAAGAPSARRAAELAHRADQPAARAAR